MIAATISGTLVVLIVGFDLLLTVLHPTRSGGLSQLVTAFVWRGVRATGSRLRIESVIGYGGMLAMVAQFTVWILGLWFGFALIYAGHLDQLAVLPQVDFGGLDPIDALYLSGVSLTTVGFGDLAAGTDWLRLVTVLEAASGLAVITAAIAYLLSVYPLVSEIRVSARQLAPAQADDRGAAEFVYHGGRTRLASIQRELIQIDESTQRFPVLYYFHADDYSASLAAVIRAASLVVMQLRFGLSSSAMPHARWHGDVLEATLNRVIENFEQRFFGGPTEQRPLPTKAEIDQRFDELRRAASEVTGVEAGKDVDLEGLTLLLGRTNSFLAELEHQHSYAYRPL